MRNEIMNCYRHNLTLAEIIPFLKEGMLLTTADGCFWLPAEVRLRTRDGISHTTRRTFDALRRGGWIRIERVGNGFSTWAATAKAKGEN